MRNMCIIISAPTVTFFTVLPRIRRSALAVAPPKTNTKRIPVIASQRSQLWIDVAVLATCSPSLSPWCPVDIRGQRRYSGHYRCPPDLQIPSNCCTWLRSKGGGPGGQAVNKSMNKAELQVDLGALLAAVDDTTGEPLVDFETIEELKRRNSKYVTKNEVVVVRSHEHRSAQANDEACMEKVRKMIREASWEEDAPVPLATLGTAMKDKPQFIQKKQKMSSMRRMRNQIRAGKFD